MYTGIDHLAFVTADMDVTIRFYRDLLGFPLVACIGEVGFKHYFFEVSASDQLAFFHWDGVEAPPKKFAGVIEEGPRNFDHVSIGVATKADLFRTKDKLEAAGFAVVGAVDHGAIWSIYVYDPNNISLEFSWRCLEILEAPVMGDATPTPAALEGAEPVSGHWPTPTWTAPEDYVARAGAGVQLRERGLADGTARSIED